MRRFLLCLLLCAYPIDALANDPYSVQFDHRLLKLIDQLRDDDRWKKRLEAAVALGRSKDIRARRPLVRALSDQHYAVRAAAVRSLAHLRDIRAVPSLLEALGDDEHYVRMQARLALEQFDLSAARPYLIHALRRKSDPTVRLGAAELLARSQHSAALEALLDATSDERAVGRFATSAIRALPEQRATELFMRGLKHPDYLVQVASIGALADMGVAKSTAQMIELLDSRVPEVSLAAAEGLRLLSSHINKQKYFVMARRSKDRFKRARAIKVLGIIGGEPAAKLLLNAMDDPDVIVRGAAVGALNNLGDPRAIPKLIEMKKHEENARIIGIVRTTLAHLQRLSEEATP